MKRSLDAKLPWLMPYIGAKRVLEQIPSVILVEPELGVGLGFCAGDEVGQFLERFARVQGGEGA